MEFERRAIAPGVHCNVIGTDKFKTNTIGVQFVSTLSEQEASKNALVPYVLVRGCERYPDMTELNRYLESLYGASLSVNIQKRGDRQIAGFYLTLLADRYALGGEPLLESAADFVLELIFRPLVRDGAFEEQIVAKEKKNLIDRIDAQINDKRRYALRRTYEVMCEGEAFAVNEYGERSRIEALTGAELYGHYRDMLQTANLEFFVIGQNGGAIAKKLAGAFAGRQRSPRALPPTRVTAAAGSPRETTDEMAVAQGKLCLGFRTGGVSFGSEDYPALVMFSGIYGATPVSKLFMNVREKLSLCYYCSSLLEKHKGLMLVNSGVEVENAGRAREEILAQLDAVRRGDFTEEEFAAARKAMENTYRSSADFPHTLADWYLGCVLAGCEMSLDDAAAALGRVTRDDVIRVAQSVTLDTIYFLRGTSKEVG